MFNLVSELHCFADRWCFSVANKNILDSHLLSFGAKVAKFALKAMWTLLFGSSASWYVAFLELYQVHNPEEGLYLLRLGLIHLNTQGKVFSDKGWDTDCQKGLSNLSVVIQDVTGELLPILILDSYSQLPKEPSF